MLARREKRYTHFGIKVIFLVLFYVTMFQRTTFGSTDLSDWQVAKRYEKFLSQKKTMRLKSPMDGDCFSLNIKNCYFNVLDINGDNCDELIVCNRLQGFHDMNLHIFRIKNKKIQYLGSIKNAKDEKGFWFSPRYHALLSVDFGIGRTIRYLNPSEEGINRAYTLYEIGKNAMRLQRSALITTNTIDGHYCFLRRHNSIKPISLKKYYKYSNGYWENSFCVDMVRNTKSNRKAFLYHIYHRDN